MFPREVDTFNFTLLQAALTPGNFNPKASTSTVPKLIPSTFTPSTPEASASGSPPAVDSDGLSDQALAFIIFVVEDGHNFVDRGGIVQAFKQIFWACAFAKNLNWAKLSAKYDDFTAKEADKAQILRLPPGRKRVIVTEFINKYSIWWGYEPEEFHEWTEPTDVQMEIRLQKFRDMRQNGR